MSDKIPSIKSQILEAADKIERLQKDISDFHSKIYGKKNPETDETIVSGWSEEIDREIAERRRVINELLDDATTAGLAHSFDEARKKFENSTKNFSRFYISVVVFLIAFGLFTLCTSNTSSLSDYISSILPILPVYGFLIWLAMIFSKRRSEVFRLTQEYNHKAAVTKSYLSFKRQIRELSQENDELLERLMGQALDTIAFNPASTLDKKHGDDLPAQQAIKETKAILSD